MRLQNADTAGLNCMCLAGILHTDDLLYKTRLTVLSY